MLYIHNLINGIFNSKVKEKIAFFKKKLKLHLRLYSEPGTMSLIELCFQTLDQPLDTIRELLCELSAAFSFVLFLEARS